MLGQSNLQDLGTDLMWGDLCIDGLLYLYCCGTSNRAVNQEYGHAGLEFSREVWDADAL